MDIGNPISIGLHIGFCNSRTLLSSPAKSFSLSISICSYQKVQNQPTCSDGLHFILSHSLFLFLYRSMAHFSLYPFHISSQQQTRSFKICHCLSQASLQLYKGWSFDFALTHFLLLLGFLKILFYNF